MKAPKHPKSSSPYARAEETGHNADAEDKLHCGRIGRGQGVRQHLACPYCFGSAEAVTRGVHAAFCDYDAASDPISFGFPTEISRHR